MLKKYLYFLLIITIGFLNPLFSVVGQASDPSLVKDAYLANQAKTIQIITVQSETANLPIISANLPVEAGLLSCESIKFTSDNLVQNQPVFNLSQPASCFKLMTKEASSIPLKKIAIASQLPLSISVVVAQLPAQVIALFRFSPAPLSSSQAASILVINFVMSSFILFKLKKVMQKNYSILSDPTNIKFRSLIVMRC